MTDNISFSLRFRKFLKAEQTYSFEIGLHIIYGESGVGKTSFIRQLAGLSTAGSENFQLKIFSVSEQIQIVLQNPDNQILCPTLVTELAFSLECYDNNSTRIQYQLEKLKKELDFITDWQRHPVTLSGGEKEILNIITILNTPARLILIDDGLSFLSPQNKEEVVVKIVQHAHENNQVILWFTSDYEDLQYSDSIWNLSLSSFTVIEDPISLDYRSKRLKQGSMNLIINSMSFGYGREEPLFHKMNFQLENIRSLGIIGLNGSGKTTLATLILGFNAPSQGIIELSVNGKNNQKIGYLDQFPERILGAGTLNELVNELESAGIIRHFNRNKFIKVLMNHQINWNLIKDMSALYIPWSTLRIALVIILTHCEYDILILDEPTFGLGWEQKLILQRYFHDFLSRKHMLLISHDVEFVKNNCDYVYLLENQTLTLKDEIHSE